ncbi:REP-associated tyrosine transposase [Anaerophaga thermohalophila]|jgi:REP element-mobilizing transposase RayT|uniref:REP-associated tyrosine transposase n=1 Tax=Anaerophaga thermohalophila TaxID=177400 RepID=UPI00030B1DEC|nr:transposase [Anaerophaga thermohalophila]
MSTGYQIKDQKGLYFLTFQVVNWVDIFSRDVYRDIVLDSFDFAMKNKGLQLFAYVIMSNHVHLVANSNKGNLSACIRDIKKYTSKQIVEAINLPTESRRDWLLPLFLRAASQHKRNNFYQVWTHENHAILLYSNDFIVQKIDYIHNNPVRSRIVQNPEDYLYSSARNYAGLSNYLDVDILSLPAKTV